MKKRISTVLAVILAMAMLMTACGTADSGGGDTGDSEKQDSSGDKKEIVLVAKVDGIAWFDDMKLGVEEFDNAFEDVNARQVAPESADAALQISLIEDCIASGVDAICIVPVDPEALSSVIEKARDAGITVIVHEGSALAGVADFDMEAFDNEEFGALYGENLAQAMGGKGDYVGIVGGLSMQTHMTWYNAAVDYITENYPDMHLVSEEPYEDSVDSTVAYEVSQEILKTYPDLGGALCMTVEAGGSFAKYLEETNNKAVKIVTLSVPSSNGNYIADGWIAYGQCWRPADAGYAMLNIAYKMLQGEEMADGVDLGKTGYESLKVKDGIIYGDAALSFTEENIAEYDF